VADWTPWKGKMACDKQTLNSFLHNKFGIDDWAVYWGLCLPILSGFFKESLRKAEKDQSTGHTKWLTLHISRPQKKAR
jgi:hypothetical protein